MRQRWRETGTETWTETGTERNRDFDRERNRLGHRQGHGHTERIFMMMMIIIIIIIIIILLKAYSPGNRTGSPQGFLVFKPYTSPITNISKHLTYTTRNIKCIKTSKHGHSGIARVYNSA